MAAFVWYLMVLFGFLATKSGLSFGSENDIHNVISSLHKLINYFRDNYKDLNLDGFFGLRVLEGQLEVLIAEHQEGQHKNLSTHIWNEIKLLKSLAQNITALGLEYVQKDDMDYFKDFSLVIKTPWHINKPERKIDPSLRWEIPQYKAKQTVKLSEKLSDKCMTELMKEGCVISQECATVMTSRGLTGYGITHQLLWATIAELMPHCNHSINKVAAEQGFGNLSQFRLEMCSNNFYEMIAVVHVLMHGKVHESHQDLFLEQQFVCPELGFYEFLKKDYLDQILSWQFPSGCYGDSPTQSDLQDTLEVGQLLEGYHQSPGKLLPAVPSSHQVRNMRVKTAEMKPNAQNLHSKVAANTIHHIVNQNSHISHTISPVLKAGPPGSILKFVANDTKREKHLDNQGKIGRKLLVEKDMGGGCLSHKTGVASGALVVYLRYLIAPGSIQWTSQHDLFLSDSRTLLQAKGEKQANTLNQEVEEGANNEEEGAADEDDANYNGAEEGDEDGDEYNQGEEDYKAGNEDAADHTIHFGANRNNDQVIINEDSEKDGADYANNKGILRQQIDFPANAAVNVEDTEDQQEDQNYYDDEGETEKGIIRHRKPPTPRPHPPVKTRKKHSGAVTPDVLYGIEHLELSTDQPNYFVILLVSIAPFFVLILFLYKFIRKRRIHIRYHF